MSAMIETLSDFHESVRRAKDASVMGSAFQLADHHYGMMDPCACIVDSSANDSEMSASFVITTGDVDRDGDILVPSGCRLDNYARNPIWLWDHSEKKATCYSLPIGTAEDPATRQLSVQVTGRSVTAKCWFDQGSDFARDLYRLVKARLLRAVSVGFDPLEKPVRRDKAVEGGYAGTRGGFVIPVWDLLEVSLTLIGANPHALRDELAKGYSKVICKALSAYTAPAPVWSNGKSMGLNESVGSEGGSLVKADASLHKFASVQINLPEELASRVLDLGKQIPDEELAEDGREDTPHVTVKYGLHTEDADDVREVLLGQRPVVLKLGKTSLFPANSPDSQRGGANYDVLKIDVESPDLHALNKVISDSLEHTDKYPEYVPHVTVAYLRPGEGQKYVGNEAVSGETLDCREVVFSNAAGNKTTLTLGDEPMAKDTKNLGANGTATATNVVSPSDAAQPPILPDGAVFLRDLASRWKQELLNYVNEFGPRVEKREYVPQIGKDRDILSEGHNSILSLGRELYDVSFEDKSSDASTSLDQSAATMPPPMKSAVRFRAKALGDVAPVKPQPRSLQYAQGIADRIASIRQFIQDQMSVQEHEDVVAMAQTLDEQLAGLAKTHMDLAASVHPGAKITAPEAPKQEDKEDEASGKVNDAVSEDSTDDPKEKEIDENAEEAAAIVEASGDTAVEEDKAMGDSDSEDGSEEEDGEEDGEEVGGADADMSPEDDEEDEDEDEEDSLPFKSSKSMDGDPNLAYLKGVLAHLKGCHKLSKAHLAMAGSNREMVEMCKGLMRDMEEKQEYLRGMAGGMDLDGEETVVKSVDWTPVLAAASALGERLGRMEARVKSMGARGRAC